MATAFSLASCQIFPVVTFPGVLDSTGGWNKEITVTVSFASEEMWREFFLMREGLGPCVVVPMQDVRACFRYGCFAIITTGCVGFMKSSDIRNNSIKRIGQIFSCFLVTIGVYGLAGTVLR